MGKTVKISQSKYPYFKEDILVGIES